MPSARTLARCMTDDQLIAAHEQAQNKVAYYVRENCLNLTPEHVRMVKATGREMVSRARHNRQAVHA